MPSAIPLHPAERSVADAPVAADTLLPQWGLTKRSIHRLCRRSRMMNTIVAAMEMRLGREEVLSLPQYMALCPTGQCNALCEFCSVTRNRTGIIKKQLPLDAILRFTGPVARVIRMYGLEGNGEPTLYDRFDDLAAALLRNGSTAYLITNGDRLTAASIDALIAGGLDAVNFSLNAATAANHRRIMKLKDFDRVLGNIRHFLRARGTSKRPFVSISMVVTHENVHEVVDFIQLGERELGVDRILVRPLSEIATELGAVEDTRQLVPFENEIVDMLEGVQDYLRFNPRRAEIEINPANFKAVRPDLPGVLGAPPGFEDRLLPPRPASWYPAAADVSVDWSWNAVRIARTSVTPSRVLETAPIPVPPSVNLRFECEVTALTGALTVSIGPPGGAPLASASARAGDPLSLVVATGDRPALSIWLTTDGRVDARLQFDRMRTPAPVRSNEFVLPHAGRWEIASPDVDVQWSDSRVQLTGRVVAGPYLLKSYSAACTPRTRISLTPDIAVSRGTVGIGVLSANQQEWLVTRTVPAQASAGVPVTFDSGENDRVHIVVYGAASGNLDALIDWGPMLERLPDRRVQPQSAHAVTPSGGASVEPSAIGNRLKRLVTGDVRYYCQKPWTDLHNFTVDGRMDVCCIATGESQARYGLGNLTTQSFQEVWNGARAREFRRTVNSGTPLPPCQRCPMLFAYQGPLFNPAGAERRVRRALEAICGFLPFGSRVYRISDRVFPPLVSHVFFRGFKR